MKALVTGMHSVLGEPARRLLTERGWEVVGWERQRVNPEDEAAVAAYVRAEQPGLILHFALGAVKWAAQLATASAELGIPLVFTSTVSVYSGRQQGPFTVERMPEPEDDYGRYKVDCEQAILQANPQAKAARIGWQIGWAAGSNNMIDYLETRQREEGHIFASTNWIQACSFVEDTVEGLVRLADFEAGGIYHLDGNSGLNFFEIVSGLNRLHGGRWQVEAASEPRLDNRLLDERIRLRAITERF